MSETGSDSIGGACSRYYLVVEKTVALSLLAYPALTLAVGGGINGVFLLVLLLALATWAVRPAGLAPVRWRREWMLYAAAMSALSVAILMSQIYHDDVAAPPHDAASRYWLAIPVFLLLQRLRPAVFAFLQFAFPAAAIAGFLLASTAGVEPAHSGRMTVATLDLIHFGDFELMLGMLSLGGLNWFRRDSAGLRIFKILGLAAGLAASLASGSRGGWLAIPVFVVLFFYFKAKRPSIRTIASAATVITLTAGVLYASSATVQSRVKDVVSDIVLFSEGKRDTSIGIRWQLYKAAADVFAHHPVFGAGPDGFAQELGPMVEAGKLTPMAAELGGAEVHNDILSKAAGMGVFGLVAILSIYFVPLRLFWHAAGSGIRVVKRTGVLGVVFVSGFLVFGLTVEVLDLTMATAFYAFTVAVLLAACYNIHFNAGPVVNPGNPNKGDQHA